MPKVLTVTIPLMLSVASLLTGCAATDLLNFGSQKVHWASAKDPVVEVLCLWEPAEGVGLNGMPTRGLGGQIYFFTRGKKTSVAARGDVRIYLFDDQGPVKEQQKPIHQFDFKGDAWQTHLRDSAYGPAYSVFIPYTRKERHQVVCSLRLRFTPEEGPVVYSDMVNLVLPGPLEHDNSVVEVNSGKRSKARLSQSTISLPKPTSRPFTEPAAPQRLAVDEAASPLTTPTEPQGPRPRKRFSLARDPFDPAVAPASHEAVEP